MKMLIKIIATVTLSVSGSLAAEWTGSAVEPENMKKIDGKPFYVITTAEELAWFANQINSGKAINGVLAADVTLGKTYAWTPIGKDSTNMFQNIFDGGNYTITAPYMNTGDYAGLFGVIGASGVVKNVKVANPSITHTRNGGAIAGFNNGTIDNVSVTGGTVATTQDPGFSGGIVGRNKGMISNTFSGSSVKRPCITRVAYAGGIAGYNLAGGALSSVSNSGFIYACKIYDSSLTNSKDNYVGGITAYNEGEIKNAKNTANVQDSIQWRNKANKSVSSYIGGVVGYNIGSIEVSNNYGKVKEAIFEFSSGCTYSIGGITGYNKGSLNRNANFGDLNLKLEGDGAKSGSTNYAKIHMGGVSGYNANVVKNSKNLGAINYPAYLSLGEYNVFLGGVIGTNYGINAKVLNSYSTTARNVQTSSDASGAIKIGGVAGQNISSALISNSYFDQTLLSTVSAPVGTQSAVLTNSGGKYTADMQIDQFAWILNTSNGSDENSGVWTRGTDGYPTFANEDSLAIRKVVFDDDGTTSNRYTNYKGLVSFPENPEAPEGFVFSGWYNADGIKVKPTTVFTADQTANAVYVDASDVYWTINFYNASPADTVLESKSYQHGSIVTYGGEAPTLASTAQYTYTFKGWDVEPTNAVEDFDYHAVYDSTIRSYTVIFNNTDGSEIESAAFEYGKMPSCSKIPTRDATAEWAYSHKGWKPALDYVTEAATYTAIYDSSKIKYKVTFMNGTTVIDEQMIPYGDSAVAPANVTREGYKFVGWNTSFAEVTEALTVKALFEELIIRIVNVVNGDGEKIDSVKVENGETYMLPEAPKKDGYTFDAYYDGNLKLGDAGDKITVTANITIIAKYIENPKSSSSSAVSSSSNPKSSSSKVGSSSSEVKSSSSTQSTVVYGELYDERDDRKYRTVVIGSQIWMAENLSYVTSESWCYKDDTSNCIKYGRLYRQGAAAQACPAGWHLPSKSEFQKLFDYVGGVSSAGLYLKTTSGWNNNSNGKDQYGFSVLPAGIRREDGYYYDIGGHAIFWMSDKYAHVDVVEAADVRIGSDNVTYGFSVRCLMTSDSSSIFVSSSSTAKSSSSVAKSSSSRVRSSSSAKSSSSSKVRSSSSAKTNAIEVSVVPQFSVQVVGRNLQISTARIENAYALFDLQGKVLLQGRVQSANFEIPVARSGNYLIRVGNNVQRIAVK